MVFWTWAKGLEDEFDGSNRRNLRQFISTEIPQIPERPTRVPSPSLRSRDNVNDETGISEMYVATLDDQFRDEVSLFLHRDTSLRRRATVGITIQEKKKPKEEKMVLVRLPTCAIFHKASAGKGVPHTFYGLLRQWPSVPRIVVGVPLFMYHDLADLSTCQIFLSAHVMPINHVPEEDRYRLTKARSIPGAVLHPLPEYTADVFRPGFYGVTYLKGFRDKFNVDIDTILNLICS